MTVPAIPFKFSNIQSEFGSNMPTTATNFTAYKKWYSTATGGYYVGVTPFTTAISTTTPFTMSSFANEAATYTASSSTYTAPGTETIPSGVKTISIELWGGGGGGSSALASSPAAGVSGGGGGAGAYVKAVLPITGTNWGQNIVVTVGSSVPGGPSPAGFGTSNNGTSGTSSIVAGGTFTVPVGTLTAPGGNRGTLGTGGAGGSYTSPGSPLVTGSNGGTGGNTPLPSPGPAPKLGGTAGAAVNTASGAFGAGGAGGGLLNPIALPSPIMAGSAGGAGRVIFKYS